MIFTPKYWPYIGEEINGANSLYNMELPLICDQGNDMDDMKRQIKLLQQFIYSKEETT